MTLPRLGITGQLAKMLGSTNPCESNIEIVRYTRRNVKRWREGDMRTRWTAAGMFVPEQQFRRIIGYRDLAKLVIAIERRYATLTATATATGPSEPAPDTDTPTVEEVTLTATDKLLQITHKGSPSKFHDDPDILGAPATQGLWQSSEAVI